MSLLPNAEHLAELEKLAAGMARLGQTDARAYLVCLLAVYALGATRKAERYTK